MIDHDLENQVRHELHHQAERVVVPPPDPHRATTAMYRPLTKEGTAQGYRMALALAIVLVVGLGAIAMLQAAQGTATTGAGSDEGSPLQFDTEVGVQLQANRLTVTTAGRNFSPTGDDVKVHGDPGTRPGADEPGYTTLELTWFEHDVEMRVNFYFASDGTDWWADEIRTYDGADPGDWITMTGEYFRSPLGDPFVGDIDVGPLHLEGLRLAAFTPRHTTCDGTGPIGGMLLELAGPHPVEGIGWPSGSTGYSTWFEVLDPATCDPIEPEGVTYVATTGDVDVAGVGPNGLTPDPDLGAGLVRIDVQFTGPGETDLTVQAIEQETGDVLAILDIPVSVKKAEDR